VHNLRVASILDELSVSFLPLECRFLEMEPKKWKKQIIEFAPDLLFVESAWKGKRGLWYNKVCRPSNEFVALLEWCKENKVPTVFWNKEDPVHFTTFMEAAMHFDYVFTTDLDCVPLYKRLLKHNRVGVLPFASPVKLFTPIEKYDRKNAICFAGSFYDRQTERKNDFINLVDELEKHWEIEIYDRNPYPDNPDYMYPQKYQKYIKGSLPVKQIDIAYKSYQFAITLNIVKHSSTMQARRAFELMSSNTIMLSNECKGLQNLFGDLIIHMDQDNRYIERMKALTEDDVLYNKLRLKGLRKVLSEHTYTERMQHVYKTVFNQKPKDITPSVCVYSKVKNEFEFERVLNSWTRQKHSKKSLICFGEGYEFDAGIVLPKGVKVFSSTDLSTKSLLDFSRETHFALFAADNYYGENYLTDILLSLYFENVPVIGKNSHYALVNENIEFVKCQGKYILIDNMKIDRCVFTRNLMPHFSDSFLMNKDSVLSGAACLAIDEFSFCENFTGNSCELVDDIEIDEGISMERIYEIGEQVMGNTHYEIERVFSGNEVLKGITCFNRLVKFVSFPDKTLGVYSANKNPNQYHKMEFAKCKVTDFDIENGLKIFFDAKKSGNFRLEVKYFDKNGEQTYHSMTLPVGSYKVLPVNEEAVEFTLDICIGGKSHALLKEVCIGATPIGPIDVHNFKEVSYES